MAAAISQFTIIYTLLKTALNIAVEGVHKIKPNVAFGNFEVTSIVKPTGNFHRLCTLHY